MSAPHVLVVAYDFPPHGAVGTQRTLRLVRHLSASGWKVTVLTAEPSSYLPGTPVDDSQIARVPDSVTVVRTSVLRPVDALAAWLRPAGRARVDKRPSEATVPAASPAGEAARPGLLRRVAKHVTAVTAIPDAEVGWFLPAVRAARRELRGARPDVVFSSAPPWTGHLVASRVARLLRVPFVADFRDPWARAPWRSARQTPAQRAAAAWLERRVVAASTRLIFATRAVRDEMAARYGAATAERSSVVPNGCDVTMFDGLPQAPANPGRFVLLHAGSLYGGRNPVPLLRAVARAVAAGRLPRDTFRVRLLGTVSLSGVDLARFLDEQRLAGIVELPGRVPQAQSLAEMKSASALLLLQPGTAMSVPAKAYEYLAAGRPVLALTPEGETAELVRDSGVGIVAAPDDEASIEGAVVELFEHQERFAGACPPSLFDGSTRAAEMEAVLLSAAGRSAPRAEHTVPFANAGVR